MLLEICHALVSVAESFLAWASEKEVKAARVRIKSLYAYRSRITERLSKLETELNSVQNEIIFLEEFVNSDYNIKEL